MAAKKNKDGFTGGALLTLEEQLKLKAKKREERQKAEQAEKKASKTDSTDASGE